MGINIDLATEGLERMNYGHSPQLGCTMWHSWTIKCDELFNSQNILVVQEVQDFWLDVILAFNTRHDGIFKRSTFHVV